MIELPAQYKRQINATAIFTGVWLLFTLDWMWWRLMAVTLPWWLTLAGQVIIFGGMPVLCVLWIWWARPKPPILRNAVYSACVIPIWQFLVFSTDLLQMFTLRSYVASIGLATTFLVGLAWVVWLFETGSIHFEFMRRTGKRPVGADVLGTVPITAPSAFVTALKEEDVLWNPLDLQTWYYGQRQRKLNQSLFALFSYALLFLLVFLIITGLSGCLEIYEMPHGGGEAKPKVQVVKVQKIIRKKFVINPLSTVIFNPPPIDEVKLHLKEVTQHTYKVGYGKGKGAGFAEGTKRGAVRFIRLEYSGGDWDQGMGVGQDLNMLIQYHVLTGHKIAKTTESRTIGQLDNFPIGKSPPVVYMTGQRGIHVSNNEAKILRKYLIDKHGMIFASNGGSRNYHNHFWSMMRRVLPGVEPVRVPLDDQIHLVPYPIPFLPYVAPHGGKDAWGWKVDGRWVCYYHPGDIGDAWMDDHAGVRREIWESCYQLGTNVIFYGHAEYSKWLEARKKK